MALSLRVGDGNSPALPLRSLHFEISGSLGKPFSGPRIDLADGRNRLSPALKRPQGRNLAASAAVPLFGGTPKAGAAGIGTFSTARCWRSGLPFRSSPR